MVVRVQPRTAVITGAPGSGKTALLAELAHRGWRIVPEAARAILREPGGMALRQDNPLGFAQQMLAREIADLDAVRDDGRWTIFDRGIGDTIGFLRLSGLLSGLDSTRWNDGPRYSGPVFFAPGWEAIYHPDAERIQTWTEAIASGAAVAEGWRSEGFELVELPLATVNERADIVEARLSEVRGLRPAPAIAPPSAPTAC